MSLKSKLLSLSIFLSCLAIGFVVATELYAFKAQFHPALGLPVFEFLGFKFYSPFSLVTWMTQFKGVFPQASNFVFFSIIGSVGVGILGAAATTHCQQRPENEGLYGSAHWASKSEIQTAGLYQNSGIFLSHDGENYLRHDGPEHLAVIAPSRTGKGAGIIVPTLYSCPDSVIVLDIKEENWTLTAGKRATIGPVLYYNPASTQSVHFNPLWEIRSGIHQVEDIQGLVNILVDPDGKGFSHDHWRLAAYDFLVATILHLLHAGTPEQKSLSGVLRFLTRTDQTFTQTLNEMLTYPHVKDPDGSTKPHNCVAEPARAMLNKTEAERSGVQSTALSFLTLYRDPIVAANTADSDFTISDLVNYERPVSLYLVVNPKQLDRLRPLMRLIITQICHRLTESINAPRKRRLLLVMDEFQTLEKLDVFEKALGYLAGFGIKALLICQSMQALKKIYGERTSILDNTHIRVFYAPNSYETAKYISDSLGNRTISYQSESKSMQRGAFVHQSKNVSSHFASRPLLTPDEVMRFPNTDSIIFVGSSAPIRAKKIVYYKDPTFMYEKLSPPILYKNEVKVYESGIKKPIPSWLHSNIENTTNLNKVTEPFVDVEKVEGLVQDEMAEERFYFEDDEDSLPSLECEVPTQSGDPKSDFDEALVAAYSGDLIPELDE